ncbi:HAD domain-containing protein [Paenibacillus tyrfis]|uniref:FCP1 homology domain-containing protein n=1 Tax=Paenibacillus tyrfis TaxID=1501230 RepID=A0A081P5A4_9BACL|nr:HAD domain-containing protein [Paenibacillus tyrfis]KEQ25877.1 hypothetical protein ET33_37570 [Paenibacillus tyrfis]
MKIIFLDIDGVLVTSRHMVQSKKYFGHEFDPECVRNLQEILEITKAKIVISSSWREGRTLKQLQSIFEINGIKNVVGMTPIIEGAIRGKEIKEYLNHILNIGLEVGRFVIIDDEEEMGELDDHLVETSFETGITKTLADKAIHFLV